MEGPRAHRGQQPSTGWHPAHVLMDFIDTQGRSPGEELLYVADEQQRTSSVTHIDRSSSLMSSDAATAPAVDGGGGGGEGEMVLSKDVADFQEQVKTAVWWSVRAASQL